MLQPLRGKILVEILSDAKRLASGLYIADNIKEIPHRGKVVSMGAPFRDRKGREFAWGFQCGHIVYYKRQWDGKKDTHQILRRDQIFAIEHADKSYAVAQYIIVKKTNEVGDGLIYVPKHFESEVSKQVDYGIVTSIGREDRLGVSVGDRLMFYRNEGLKVNIPLQEDLWSLAPRAIIGIITKEGI